MSRAFQLFAVVCLVAMFAGCGDDDPVSTKKYPNPEPDMAGNIGVYADAAGTDANIADTGGTVTLYVVHKAEEGATASAFKIQAPAGWTRIGAQAQFPLVIGNVDDGVSVAYNICKTGAVHVMTLTYDSPGNTAQGAVFQVLPHNTWPQSVQVVDCFDTLHDGTGLSTPVITQ